MFRKILMTAPALALTLPFMAASPTMARPLAVPVDVHEWGIDDDDDDKGNDQFLDLQYCTELQLEQNTDGRSYECAIDRGPSCLTRCTAEAVAPLCGGLDLAARSGACITDKIAVCERQCEAGGAAFCSPLHARGRDDDQEIFVELISCMDLEVDT